MNETYDKLIDIIAVDIKLAIELIKGQDINVGEFVTYMFEWRDYPNMVKIDGIQIESYGNHKDLYLMNISSNGYKTGIGISNGSSIKTKESIIKYLNNLKNEQN